MVVGGLLFIYVASIGPVAAWVDHNENTISGETVNFLKMIYSPIAYACRCKPIAKCFSVYISFWMGLNPAHHEM